jgi:hypothetical protein
VGGGGGGAPGGPPHPALPRRTTGEGEPVGISVRQTARELGAAPAVVPPEPEQKPGARRRIHKTGRARDSVASDAAERHAA